MDVRGILRQPVADISRGDRIGGTCVKRLIGLALALPFVLAAAGPAAAYQIISEVGPHGNVYLDDTTTMPAGTCTYGDIVFSNIAYLKSMKVRAPHVFAADRNSDLRDHRVVSWQWNLQRKNNDAATPKWKVVKSSGIQRKTAWEDQQAAFSAMTINYNSESRDDPGHHTPYIVYRAMVIIKWYKPNGDIESTVKLVPSLYRTKTYWNAGPSTDACSLINTDG